MADEKVLHEVRVVETEDGFRIEIKGDKERLKEMFSKGFPFGGLGRMMMGGFGPFGGRHGHHGRHEHHHGPFGWGRRGGWGGPWGGWEEEDRGEGDKEKRSV